MDQPKKVEVKTSGKALWSPEEEDRSRKVSVATEEARALLDLQEETEGPAGMVAKW